MTLPYLAIGNNELGEPLGDMATCPKCGKPHPVENSRPPRLQFVKCGKESYLVGVDGKEYRRP